MPDVTMFLSQHAMAVAVESGLHMSKDGFDNGKYVKLQSEKIRERISDFGGKLYLEFGGKLFDDYHASRVLPGFRPDSKIEMLVGFREDAEIVIAISALDIEGGKTRADLGITYDLEVLRLADAFREKGLFVNGVVVTQYSGQPSADAYCRKLERLGIRVYKHKRIEGYPSNVDGIFSDAGFGSNDYVETKGNLVVVTAPGPGCGKMSVCLSQLYQDGVRGIKSGYAKFETFPLWNYPLKHLVNLAYEAATADLDDVNMIDPFHLEAYGETAVNYNRDVEIFPALNTIFKRIFGESPYKSPTDMGVNMAGHCIVDDDVVAQASRMEIVRRYFETLCNAKRGLVPECSVGKVELLMSQAGASVSDRKVVDAVRGHRSYGSLSVVAIELPDGRIVTGKSSDLMSASSAVLLNAVKAMARMDDAIHLLSPSVIEPVQNLKSKYLLEVSPHLRADETLVALSVCATTNPYASHVLGQLPKLRGCEAHSSSMLNPSEGHIVRKLGLNLTCEPEYPTDRFYNG